MNGRKLFDSKPITAVLPGDEEQAHSETSVTSALDRAAAVMEDQNKLLHFFRQHYVYYSFRIIFDILLFIGYTFYSIKVVST